MKPRLRSALVLAALILAVGAGVGAASALVPPQHAPTSGAAEPSHFEPQKGTVRLGAVARDPLTSDPWTVRTYRSEAGVACAEPGRVRGGVFGRVDSDGSFHPLDVEASGACADTPSAPFTFGVNHYPANGSRPAVAALFGTATNRVQSVTVRTNVAVHVVPVVDESFLLVVPDADLAGGTAEIRVIDEPSSSYPLHTAHEIPADAPGPASP